MSDEDISQCWREEKACDDLEFKFQMKQAGREKAASVAEKTLRCAPVSSYICSKFGVLFCLLLGTCVELRIHSGWYVRHSNPEILFISDGTRVRSMSCFFSGSSAAPLQKIHLILVQKFSWISNDDMAHGKTPHSDMWDTAAPFGEKANRVEPWSVV